MKSKLRRLLDIVRWRWHLILIWYWAEVASFWRWLYGRTNWRRAESLATRAERRMMSIMFPGSVARRDPNRPGTPESDKSKL